MQEFPSPLFTTKVTQGRRTFFFDVRNTKEEKPYLRITESSLKGDQKQRNNVMVFSSEVPGFKQALEDAVGFMDQQAK